MKFHWDACLENDFKDALAKQLRLTDELRVTIDKKNKQICNLELYVNELNAKLKIRESNEI